MTIAGGSATQERANVQHEPAPEDRQQSIRIVIADDHAIVREGLRSLLATEPGMDVVGEAADGVEAVALVREHHPDVAVLDLVMPRMDGIAAIAAIRRESPHTRILVVSNYADEDLVMPAIRSGALGYLLKDAEPGELLGAIRDVARGAVTLHPLVARLALQEMGREAAPATAGGLTDRELDVLRLLARGFSNHKIAEQLWVGERTVRAHVSSILRKLQLANRTQATLYALREGLVDLAEPGTA